MSIIDRVKNHISDNRGKYGAVAGAGAMYGASQVDSPLINQAGFNVLAKGQNLALDTADKIDPRAVVALNDLGMHKIRQEDIDASNALYNSGVAKYINPNPVNMVNANEHSTELYNRVMAAKAGAQDALVNAKNQGQDYIDQGINYVKGLNPFTESTIPGKTMKIEIKKALLEGHQPEVIVEGAIGKFWKAKADNAEMKALNAKLNYKDNLGQYLLNPFVDGPLKQLGNKLTSLIYQALMKVFFTGEKITSIEILEKKVKALGNTPFSRQMGILVEEIKLMPEINKKIKDEHFIQWLINPLVPGPKDYFKYKKQLESNK